MLVNMYIKGQKVVLNNTQYGVMVEVTIGDEKFECFKSNIDNVFKKYYSTWSSVEVATLQNIVVAMINGHYADAGVKEIYD